MHTYQFVEDVIENFDDDVENVILYSMIVFLMMILYLKISTENVQ